MDRTDTSLIALRRILRATELYARTLAQTAGLTPVQIRVLQIVLSADSITPKKNIVADGRQPPRRSRHCWTVWQPSR